MKYSGDFLANNKQDCIRENTYLDYSSSTNCGHLCPDTEHFFPGPYVWRHCGLYM